MVLVVRLFFGVVRPHNAAGVGPALDVVWGRYFSNSIWISLTPEQNPTVGSIRIRIASHFNAANSDFLEHARREVFQQ